MTPDAVESAHAAADSAARASRVTLRELGELPDLHRVVALFDDIWHPESAPVSVELMRALTKAGNYVAGAFDGNELVGASVGFFGAPAHSTLHSHIAGVASGMAGRSVGYALKLHQRAWCLTRDVTAIEWTFDPLVRRNAYFNLVKLGARPVEYLVDFYGPMQDGINGDDETDRLLVRWNLVAPPAPRSYDPSHHLVAVPPDIEAMRRSDPDEARRWRLAVRGTLGTLMAAGGVVTGFDRDGGYAVEHQVVERQVVEQQGVTR